MAKHLEDIGKDAKDLLTQDFPNEGSVKFTTQSRTSENVTVKSSFSRVVKRDKVVREIVGAAFEDKWELPAHNLEFNAKISSNRDLSGSVAVKDWVGLGSKIELNVAQNPDGVSATPQLIFKNNNVALKGKVIYPISGKSTHIKLFAEAGFVASNIYAGLGTAVTLENSGAAVLLEGVGSYYYKNHQITARVNHALHGALVGLGITYYQTCSSICKFAIDTAADTSFDKFGVVAGGEYKVDKFTTVKGKVGYKQYKNIPDVRVSLALKQQISPSITAIFGSDLNGFSFAGVEGGEPHTFGLELKYDHK